MRTNKIKILHAPVNIGNQPSSLSHAEKEMGHKSIVVVNAESWTGFPSDVNLIVKSNRDVLGYAKRLMFGLFAPFYFDVLNYYFGKSILTWEENKLKPFRHYDLKLAKLFGKKLSITFQGCDLRLAKRSNEDYKITMCNDNDCRFYKTCLSYTDNYRTNILKEIIGYFDYVFFLNPDLKRFVPNGQFLPYSSVDVQKIVPKYKTENKRPLILHAPSEGSVKGTKYITEALGILKKEFDFDFVTITGMSNKQALLEYEKTNLVIDQILAGWYGAFAVEVMAMGKPVVCYIREEDLHAIPSEMKSELPFYNVDKNRLVEDLRQVLIKKSEWAEVGKRSRRFVVKWHDPNKISKLLMEMYSGQEDHFRIEKLNHDL